MARDGVTLSLRRADSPPSQHAGRVASPWGRASTPRVGATRPASPRSRSSPRLATGAGNMINDYFDGHRPHQQALAPAALGAHVTRAAVVLDVWRRVGVTAFRRARVARSDLAAIVIAWQVALYAYARWCKRVLGAGNLLVAAISASAFAAGALAAGRPRAAADSGCYRVWIRDVPRDGQGRRGPRGRRGSRRAHARGDARPRTRRAHRGRVDARPGGAGFPRPPSPASTARCICS